MLWKSPPRILSRERLIVILGVVIGIGLAWFYLHPIGSRRVALRISAGRSQGLRHAMAGTLARDARRHQLELILVPTAGSEVALDQVDSGLLDVALVQGGLDPRGRENVRQVAALHVEPLHLLVKEELAAKIAENLGSLRGKSINLGESGSGTHALSLEVLRFAGLEPGRDFTPTSLSYLELEERRDRSALPDAVFMVSLLPSPVAKILVTRDRYRLVPLPFGEAFVLENGDRATPAVKGGISHDLVVEATIPTFTYGLNPAVPANPVQTLGTRLLLVANKDVRPDAISRLLTAAFTTSFAHLAHPPLSTKLLELPPELPMHEGTLVFQEQSKPVNSGEVIDSVEKELSIAGAIVGALFFLWQWLKSRYRRRRESGFEHYIQRVGAIENRSLEIELSADLDLKELLSLQSALGQIKAEAIAKFAQREIDGEDLMTGFLAHASDARDHLTRLILHRRDQLERQARKQKRPLDDVWREAVGEDRDGRLIGRSGVELP